MRRDSISKVRVSFMTDVSLLSATVPVVGWQYRTSGGYKPGGAFSITFASGRSAGRSECDLFGAWRYEVDRIRRPLLAPHLVGDFTNDLAVFHLKKVDQAHGKFRPNGIGNVGHLVADHRNVTDLVIEHE